MLNIDILRIPRVWKFNNTLLNSPQVNESTITLSYHIKNYLCILPKWGEANKLNLKKGKK